MKKRKFAARQYMKFQAMAFSDLENWRWYDRPVWWYLNTFVWLHQGIVHKNWNFGGKE